MLFALSQTAPKILFQVKSDSNVSAAISGVIIILTFFYYFFCCVAVIVNIRENKNDFGKCTGESVL